MVARRHVDMEDDPELGILVKVVQEQNEPIEIRRAGAIVAVIEPPQDFQTEKAAPITEEERAAFLSAAGSWKGIIDLDEFIENNEASRQSSFGRPIEL